eukprot:UN10927
MCKSRLIILTILALDIFSNVFAESHHPLFETYQGYKEGKIGQRFKDKFDKYIPFEGRNKLHILHLGAKTSDFSENMYKDGFINIDNIDLLEDKMNIMKERMKQLKIPNTVRFDVSDMFEFGEANKYDVVIDKGVVELTNKGHDKYLPHCWDILKENGLFITIGPFPPQGSKENGWWISGEMAPSNWKTERKNGWKMEGIEVLENTFIRVPHPEKFYLYILKKVSKRTKTKDEM